MQRIFELFEKHGADDYIGENITQLEHAIQCAMLIEADYPADREFILAGLLHDIGHLLQKQAAMGSVGVAHHESLGSAFLLENGFSERIVCLVRNHVNAKRYIVAQNYRYYEQLSDASKQTLHYQGGVMGKKEMHDFEQDPYFSDSLKLRYYDDRAKVPHLRLKPLSYYLNIQG